MSVWLTTQCNMYTQGVVTYALLVEAFATRIVKPSTFFSGADQGIEMNSERLISTDQHIFSDTSKMLLFHVKTIVRDSRNSELACLKKKRKMPCHMWNTILHLDVQLITSTSYEFTCVVSKDNKGPFLEGVRKHPPLFCPLRMTNATSRVSNSMVEGFPSICLHVHCHHDGMISLRFKCQHWYINQSPRAQQSLPPSVLWTASLGEVPFLATCVTGSFLEAAYLSSVTISFTSAVRNICNCIFGDWEGMNCIGMSAPWVAVHFLHSLHGCLPCFGVTKSILGK